MLPRCRLTFRWTATSRWSCPRIRSLSRAWCHVCVVPAVADARLMVRARNSQVMLTNDTTRDALTGLWNRRSSEPAINRASCGDTLVLIDLDHFTAVKDTYGHAAGDEVLATFASCARRRLRHLDIMGRLGGEEFVILLPETGLPDASPIMCRPRSEWSAGAPYGTTFSAGDSAAGGFLHRTVDPSRHAGRDVGLRSSGRSRRHLLNADVARWFMGHCQRSARTWDVRHARRPRVRPRRPMGTGGRSRPLSTDFRGWSRCADGSTVPIRPEPRPPMAR